MKTLFSKLMVFDDVEPIMICVYKKREGAPYEVMLDGQFWATCENGAEVDDEIKEIMDLYHYNFFPRF